MHHLSSNDPPLFTGEHQVFGTPNNFKVLSLGEQAPLKAERYFRIVRQRSPNQKS